MRTSVRFRIALLLVAALVIVSGCAAPAPATVERVITATPAPAQPTATPQIVEKVVKETVVVEKEVERVITATPEPRAKYVFLFIGDGMGVAQRNAAELYMAATQTEGKRPEDIKLVMNTFPGQGMNTTYDLTRVIPDSASTATALSTGHKTASGVVGMNETGEQVFTNLSEIAKAKGMKVGIISTVSIDHATPAAFYTHVPHRDDYYGISVALANSDYDFFGGGDIKYPTGKKKDQANVYEIAQANGFAIVRDRQEFLALGKDAGRVWAINPTIAGSSAMPYALDRDSNNITLGEYVEKAAEILDNPNGFFLSVEAGKIDWACHANDAAASIHDTLELDDAVAKAVEFYEAHPDET
ncbi:MAG: alkaline phosphatase, partial [Anaerolineae bacterium]